MTRFLFVVPPLTGHLLPADGVARALERDGAEVAWAGPESVLRPVLGPTATVFPTGTRLYRELRGERDVVGSFLTGYVVPLARFTMTAVAGAATRFDPDVLVVDQHALAGTLTARRLGRPWATLMPTSAALAGRTDPAVAGFVRGPLAALCAAAGLPPEDDATRMELLYSPHLQIAFTTAALAGIEPSGPHVALVGPVRDEVDDGPDPAPPPEDDGTALVLVTVGTLNMDIASDFFARIIAALTPLADRVRAVVVAAGATTPPAPAHITVVPWAPLARLMPRAAAVVCHGGLGTVGSALAEGVPVVVAPITLDHPVMAAQVTAAGAGVEVDFAAATPGQLRAAVLAVLDDPTYRTGAGRIRESIRAAGGAGRAAALLRELARTGAPR
jgi:MGT family glycosyltransferase